MKIAPPIAMLAELTHRCPLSCPYCSNPVEMARQEAELDTATWARVFREAAEMGVVQLHLSGGEPASRRDLVDLVAAARDAGLYTNLITSGIGLTEKRLQALDEAGLDHVQLSLQGTTAQMADAVGGYRGGFDRKMQVAAWIGKIGFPLTLNAVLHRHNLHQLPRALEMAVEMGARRIEVATVQFHGWALKNRTELMPTKAQAREATRIVAEARAALKGTLVIDYVPADYHEDYPKRCMGGWGSSGLNVAPDGQVPRDNPFVGQAANRPEIWSFGHSNVQGADVDPASGALWTIEHDSAGGDAVNHNLAGRNYGWPRVSFGVSPSGKISRTLFGSRSTRCPECTKGRSPKSASRAIDGQERKADICSSAPRRRVMRG